MAEKQGHGTVHRPAASTLDLRMPVEGKLCLEVRLPRTLPAAWSFAARDPSTGFRWGVRWEEVEEATYFVRGLSPGRLILIVDAAPKSGETEVVVVACATVSATVEVPE